MERPAAPGDLGACAVAAMLDAVVAIDAESRIVNWNPAAEALFGWPAAEAVGKVVHDLIVPERFRDADRRAVRRAAHQPGALIGRRVRVPALHRDGHEFQVELAISLLSAEPPRFLGVMRSVEASSRDASEGSEHEWRHRALVRHLPDANILYFDEQLRVVDVHAHPGSEWEPAAMVGRSVAELLPGGSGLEERYRDFLKGEAQTFEWENPQTPGHWYEVQAVPVISDEGGLRGGMVLSRDISERKRAEMRLRASEQRFRTIVESARDGVWLLDQDDRTTFVNARMAEMLGWAPEDLVGRPKGEFIHPDDRASLQRSLEQRRGGIAGDREVRFRRRDGETLHAIVSTSPLVDDGGAYAGSLSMVTDITQRVLDEREREKLRAALHQSQKLESIGRLAGGVAHDFNNLLSVILNYAEFVADAVADRPEVAADVGEITAAAQRAAGLTRQLLVFSRRDVAKPTVLDLTEVIADMETLLRRTLGGHAELRVEAASAGCHVHADRGQVEQVLLNLALNASDAMPQGGTLRVALDRRQLDGAELAGLPTLAPGPYVRLVVEDDGEGMDPTTAARAFDPFFTTKPAGEGTGLGLATVYGIVTEAGGEVTLHSAVGRGTRIVIHLPEAPEPVGDAGGDRVAGARGSGELVLVVEDEDAVRSMAARVLRASGYDVVEAPDPRAALDLDAVRSGSIDLLLTDIVMPGMSGPDLSARLTEQQPDLPVVFTSGYAGDALVRHGLRRDDVAFLQKPFTAAALLEKVRAALGDA